MRVAKPSLPITQFARRFCFCSKFRAFCQCENLFSLKLRDKFGVKFSSAVLSDE
ncbi:hypothetical protein [Campylobacter concisus]|uniref:hypothetical protein n=1 Tax=Campylobacter concisus TaxID=199 RepID=UPI001F23AE3F|nr:hypothetical protein [Campylobacter concisus]